MEENEETEGAEMEELNEDELLHDDEEEVGEDDNNNDAEDGGEDLVNEEDIVEEDDEGDEEETMEGEEGNEENGESKKRKATGSESAAKKLKVEPKPVRMNLYVKRVGEDSFGTSVESFLTENEIEMSEFKANTDPIWNLVGEVTLTKPEDKDKTLTLTGKEIDSHEVKFEFIEEPIRDESLKKLQAPDEVILFLRNFQKETTEEDLKKLFPTCVELHVPQKNGRSKGFAFLQFSSKEEVQEMIKTKQNTELGGRKLILSRFASRGSSDKSGGRSKRYVKTKDQAGNSQNKVLFVGNLSFDTKEDKIMRIFRTAESVKILRFANTGKSKGVAFLEFRTPLAARKAFEKFSNAKVDGRSINLEFADQEKFKTGDRGSVSRGMVGRDSGRRLSGGPGGRHMQGFGAGGRNFRDAGNIRSLLDNMQYERELENRFGRMGGMDGGMGGGMGFGMDTGMGTGMGLDRGMGGRMSLDSSFGLDGGYSSRMGMDSGMGGRMSLDGGMGRQMGMSGGYGMADQLSLDRGFGNRMGMDTGLGNFTGGRMGTGMDSGNFGGGFKNRGMNNRSQGTRKRWN